MLCLILFPLINNDLQAKLPRVYFPNPSTLSHFSPSQRGSLTFHLLNVWNNSPKLGSFLPLDDFFQHICSSQVEERRTSSSSVTVCASQRNNSKFALSPRFNGVAAALSEDLTFLIVCIFFLCMCKIQNK